MKLRNKKTGEVCESCFVAHKIKMASLKIMLADCKKYADPSFTEEESILGIYNTLSELNENWEDYIPKEPLIKDEKVRETIKAWRNCNQDDCFYVIDGLRFAKKKGNGSE